MGWDLSKDRPIYAQLIEELQLRIVTGIYQAGQKLPSVRDLASEAAVNPNTMQRALTELERDGLLYTQRTSGRYITEDLNMIQKAKESLAYQQVKLFLERMAALGYSIGQAQEILQIAAKGETK